MHVILLALLVPVVVGHVEDGFMASQLPTVALTGEPRVIARRIWRGQQIGEVAQHLQSRAPSHGYPVETNYIDGPVQGRPVTVYRRVLRPARLIYTGGDVVTHQWVGGDDNNERQEFFRMPQASAIEGFKRN
ncbi:hypothetical protein Aduo_011658 [Ancylostoma duodenale]